MYVIDSCSLRSLTDDNKNFRSRFLAVPNSDIWLSLIAAQEAIEGRLAEIKKAQQGKSKISISKALDELMDTLHTLCQPSILPYTEEDERVFKNFTPAVKRIGPNDCRIAAQAIRRNWVVISQNMNDFDAIGAVSQDWTRSD